MKSIKQKLIEKRLTSNQKNIEARLTSG